MEQTAWHSTSLLEGLTWGYIAAEDILPTLSQTTEYKLDRVKDWIEAGETVDPPL